ncbi:hypothetical protein SANA_23180 [Gottschalkiaceae bacterium SANA]|nr:hypothetical protein SANA_23180 [Gottschalkiaceae bacterium SANA]
MLLKVIDQRANLITDEMQRNAREISREIAALVHQGHDMDELVREGRMLLHRTLGEVCEAFLV